MWKVRDDLLTYNVEEAQKLARKQKLGMDTIK